jgi:glycosyltransferase involved in cell wall biosynthesis
LTRVTHIITTLERGGAENSLLQLAIDQTNLGIEVEIIFLKGKPELMNLAISHGIRVSTDFSNHFFLVQLYRLWKRKVNSAESREVFHAHLSRAELLTRLALRSESFVITRHNEETVWRKIPNLLSSALSRFITKHAKVVAISESVRTFMYNNREIALNKVVPVIYYSYSGLTISDNSSAKKIFTNDDLVVFHIGTVSRLAFQKGLDILISATYLLKKEGVDLHLYILGDGPEKKKLKRLAASLDLDNNLTFLPRVPEPRFFIRELDLFILSSRYEGLGRVLLEAMEMQVPIVASKKGAIPEVLGADHPGLFSPVTATALKDKIKEFILDIRLPELSIKRQNERLRFFTFYRPAPQYQQLYMRITET